LKKKKNQNVIGIVGGFGSYATLNFFEMILDAYPVEKEWQRPRIIIDNYCTLPSRVRCILYGEMENEIIDGLVNSVSNLIKFGATSIIITCNTAHYFLDEIYKKIPESEGVIVNIIEELAVKLNHDNIQKVSLIASEGTILSKIYDESFEKYNIKINTPSEEEFYEMRELIEVVKQNMPVTGEVKEKFKNLLYKQKDNVIILVCSEFPVLYKYVKDDLMDLLIYDPLKTALEKI